MQELNTNLIVVGNTSEVINSIGWKLKLTQNLPTRAHTVKETVEEGGKLKAIINWKISSYCYRLHYTC